MLSKRPLFALALPALLVAVSTVYVNRARADQCVFDKYTVSSALPFSTDENYTWGPYSVLRGAQLYVPAREGLTAEWLHLLVEESLSAQACRLPVSKVHVLVTSAGPGFWVRLGAPNQLDAQQLVRWAEGLAPARIRHAD